MAFKVGDEVVLKSGGKPMMLAEQTAGGWRCVWQDDNGKPQEAVYPEALLKEYDPLARLPIVL